MTDCTCDHDISPARLPRVMVAAPASGQGKTTVATGLIAALRVTGLTISGHKVGPDYIDPTYHAAASGRTGRNLDPHLVGEHRVAPLLRHGAAGADLAVIEGVMGLHDGRLGTDGFASSAHVARLTDTPVVLVVDASKASRSVAATAAGIAMFDRRVTVAGVILNRVGSARHVHEIGQAMRHTGISVVGAIPTDRTLDTPSRHLGLVTATEREDRCGAIDRFGDIVGHYVDLDHIRDIAAGAPDMTAPAWDPEREVGPRRSGGGVIAVATGPAFTARYAETDELLRAAGGELAFFDPLVDADLPTGTSGIYLGGGYPELHARDLAANREMRAAVTRAAADGIPIVAEGGGLVYLSHAVDGEPMTSVIDGSAAMAERLTLRYPVAESRYDTLLTRVGERVAGHEFHRTRVAPATGPTPAWSIDGTPDGFASPRLHASYLHVHWAGYPEFAVRFVAAGTSGV